MTASKQFPFGSWPSPLTPENLGGLRDISEISWTEQGKILWRERDSSRTSVMRSDLAGNEVEILSGRLQVGGKLLYGGGSYHFHKNTLVVVDRKSNQLMVLPANRDTSFPLTSKLVQAGSPKISPGGEWVIYSHSDGDQDSLCLTAVDGGHPPQPLDQGADFYNYPRWHPDGNQIAWMSWDHPHMPWDSSSIWLGELNRTDEDRIQLTHRTKIAGGVGISTLQPEFSPDGGWLAYISDQTGWWQLYLYDLANHQSKQLTKTHAEHGLPPWLQDRNAFAFSPDSRRIYFLRNQLGKRTLWSLDLRSGLENQIILQENYTWMDWLAVSPVEDRIALVASAPDLPPRLICVTPEGEIQEIRNTSPGPISRKIYSHPRHITWTGPSHQELQGLFYPPHNPGQRVEGTPPLLVMIHSGPTRQKFFEFQPRTQYFTSRGYAVLEVNYRGSSGYGRIYRQSLKGVWGEADVADCLSGAEYVTGQGWADPEHMFLMGSSSGGLTVFQILVRYPGVFQAGITLYAVVNHLDLLKNPPKFERFYSHWLIGPYPQAEKLYRDRSPVFFADRIQDPVAVFQGGRDPIVPLEQAEQIIKALDKNGVPYQFSIYPDESHGFKKKENLADFYRKTELFLSQFLPD